MAGKRIEVQLGINADVAAAKKSIKDLETSLSKLYQAQSQRGFEDFGINKAVESAQKLEQSLHRALNVDTGKLDLSKFSTSLKQAGTSLTELNTQFLQAGTAGQQVFLSLANSIAQAEVPLKKTSRLVQEFSRTLKNTVSYQLSASMFNAVTGALHDAVSYTKNLNGSLNEIRIVTGQSADQMAKFAQSANAAAKQLSTTTNNYAKASLIFYQQGLSDADVKKRTDAVIKMANVTKESADDVSSYMTAIWNNFDDGSKSLERYADVMTALGAATASSTKEIAAGLEKFASIGKTIGLSYEYATSAVATIVDKTRQSADTVGTGLRTIFSRLQGLSLGETLEDGVDLNKYSAALKTVGVNILDASGNMRDMDAILESLAGKWQNLSTAQKTALAQTVGGVRQYTTLISLMDNWDSMERNLNTANTSAGSLQKQQDIYAESWEAASERSKAALEGLYQTLLNDKGFITLINGLTGVTEAVTVLANALGGLPGILGMVGMISTKVFSNQISSGIQTAITNLSAWQSQFKGQGFFKSLGLIGSGQSKSAAQMKAKNEAQKISAEYDKQMQSMKQAGKQDTSAYYAASAAKELLAAKTDLLNVENQLSDIQKKNAQDQIVLMGKQQQALLELKQEKEQMAKDDKKQAALDERQVLNSISYNAGGGYIRDDKEQAAAILKGKFNNNIMNIRTGYEQATYKKTMAQKFKSYAGSIDGNDAAAMAQLRSGINDVFGAGSVAETDGLKEILSLLAQIESKAQRAEDRIDAAVKSADGGAQGALRNLGTNGRLAGEANASVDYEKWFKEGQYRRTQGQFQQGLKGEGQKGDGSKAGEKIAAGAQTAMQAVSALTSGITQAQSAMETFGDSGATAGEKIAAGMSIASGAATAFATGGWIGLAAYAVGSIGMVLYQAIDDAYHAEEIAADKAEQAASALAESYKNVKAEYDNVLSTVESYESASESLDALVIGTDEWKEALIEANEAALKLIDNFNLIKGEDYTVNTDGSISFTKAGQSKIDDGQTQMLNDTIAAQSAASLAQAEAAQARAEANKDVTTKSNDKGRWATAAGLGGGYALAGGMIGAAGGPIGAAIGAILGGAVGFLGGLWAYDHDQEIINNAEKAKIDNITEIYKKNKNDTELEQLINEQFANESESYRQSIMDIVKTTVEASEQLSDAMALAAQSSLNANKTYQNMKDAEAQADVSARAAQVYEQAYAAKKEEVKAGMENEELRKQYANAYEEQLRKQYGESVEVGSVNSDGSFSYTYLDANHQRQTAEVMASEVITYMATQAGQSAIDGQIDQWAQVFGDWRSGSKDERAMAAFGGQGLRTATKEELDALNSDYKSYFEDLTPEELAALGYESAEAAIAAFEEQMGGDTGITAAWEKAISGMGDIDTSFIEKMSLETAQKFTNSIEELSNGPIQNVGQILNDGLMQAFNEANVKEADKGALLAQIADIDWSDYDAFDQFVAIFENMGYSIDEASAYWTGFTANMRQAGTAIPDFTKLKTTLSSIAKITQDLKLGDIVSEEDYKALIDYNSAWEDFFVLQADGSRKFIGDADSMRAATQQMALEQKALLDSYKEVSDIEAVQNFNWSDTSGEGTVKSDFLGIYDANIALQEMLTTAGYTRDQIVSIFDAAANGDTAALETLFSFIQKATDPAQMSQATTDLEEMIASTATSVEELQSMLSSGTISQETYSKSLLSMASGYEYCAEAVKAYQEALASGEGVEEAEAALERVVELEREAAKYEGAWKNAISGKASMTAEDLTVLKEMDPNLYAEYLSMSDEEWYNASYEAYSQWLSARIAGYPEDSAAYKALMMAKRQLDEDYYEQAREKAIRAKEEQDAIWDKQYEASSNAMGIISDNLASTETLSFQNIVELEKELTKAGVSAERIKQILTDVQSGDSTEAVRAKTVAAMEAAFMGLAAQNEKAKEYNGLITIGDIDVSDWVKEELDNLSHPQGTINFEAETSEPDAYITGITSSTTPTKIIFNASDGGSYEETLSSIVSNPEAKTITFIGDAGSEYTMPLAGVTATANKKITFTGENGETYTTTYENAVLGENKTITFVGETGTLYTSTYNTATAGANKTIVFQGDDTVYQAKYSSLVADPGNKTIGITLSNSDGTGQTLQMQLDSITLENKTVVFEGEFGTIEEQLKSYGISSNGEGSITVGIETEEGTTLDSELEGVSLTAGKLTFSTNLGEIQGDVNSLATDIASLPADYPISITLTNGEKTEINAGELSALMAANGNDITATINYLSGTGSDLVQDKEITVKVNYEENLKQEKAASLRDSFIRGASAEFIAGFDTNNVQGWLEDIQGTGTESTWFGLGSRDYSKLDRTAQNIAYNGMYTGEASELGVMVDAIGRMEVQSEDDLAYLEYIQDLINQIAEYDEELAQKYQLVFDAALELNETVSRDEYGDFTMADLPQAPDPASVPEPDAAVNAIEQVTDQEALNGAAGATYTQASTAFEAYDWHGIGISVAEGISQGIADGIASFTPPDFSPMAGATKDAAAQAYDVNSPSKIMKPIGHGVVEGIEVGIDEGIAGSDGGDFTPMAQQSLENAKSAFGVHSPSVLFMPIGEDVVAGVEVGIDNGTANAAGGSGWGDYAQRTFTNAQGAFAAIDTAGIGGTLRSHITDEWSAWEQDPTSVLNYNSTSGRFEYDQNTTLGLTMSQQDTDWLNWYNTYGRYGSDGYTDFVASKTEADKTEWLSRQTFEEGTTVEQQNQAWLDHLQAEWENAIQNIPSFDLAEMSEDYITNYWKTISTNTEDFTEYQRGILSEYVAEALSKGYTGNDITTYVQGKLDEQGLNIKFAVGEAWGQIKDIMAEGVATIVKGEQDAAKQVYEAWVSAFAAISKARLELMGDSDGSLLSSMQNDVAGLSDLYVALLDQGYNLEQIWDIVTATGDDKQDKSSLLNYGTPDFNSYRQSGNQRYLNWDGSINNGFGGLSDTSVDDFFANLSGTWFGPGGQVTSEMNEILFGKNGLISDDLIARASLGKTTAQEDKVLGIYESLGLVTRNEQTGAYEKGSADAFMNDPDMVRAIISQVLGIDASWLQYNKGEDGTITITVDEDSRGEAETWVQGVQGGAMADMSALNMQMASQITQENMVAMNKQQEELTLLEKARDSGIESLTVAEQEQLRSILGLSEGADLSAVSLDTLTGAAEAAAQALMQMANQAQTDEYMALQGYKRNADGSYSLSYDDATMAEMGYSKDANGNWVRGEGDTQETLMSTVSGADAYARASGYETGNEVIDNAADGTTGKQVTADNRLALAKDAGFESIADQNDFIRNAENRTIVGVNGESKNLMATQTEIRDSMIEGRLSDQDITGWNSLDESWQSLVSKSLGEGKSADQIEQILAATDGYDKLSAAQKEALKTASKLNLSDEERAELLKEAEKIQQKYANQLKKMEKAYDRLAKEGRDLLKTANDEEASMSERAAAVDGLREIYTDILGPMDKVGDAFVKNADNMKLAEEAAAGNEESLNKLQVAYLEALAGVDFQGPLQDLAAEVAAWDPGDLEVGATIDDTDFLAKCAELVNKAGLTADQASDALSAMGVDAEIEEHEVPIGEDGTTTIQAQGTIYVPKVDENGNVSYEAVDATGGYTIEGESGQVVKYYTIKGAKYNGKGVTGGGGGGTGGGGRRGGGGGGGGGGGRRDPRHLRYENKKDHVERYHEIDNTIDDLADAYERLNKEEDRAWGQNRINAMKAQTNVIKDQISAIKSKIDEARKYKQEDLQAALDAGWTFDPTTGNVNNYEEFMSAQVDKYNDAIKAYNNMDADAQEALDKKWAEYQDPETGEYKYSSYEDYLKQTLIDGPKEALEQYEETMELLEDLGMEYDDLLNAWHDNIIGQIQTKLDTTLEVTEAQLGYLEHKLSRIEDDAYSAAEAIGLMGQQMDIAQTQFDAHKSALDDLLKAYSPEGTVWSAEDLMNGNISSEDLVNAGMQSGDIELIQTIMEGMMDASEQMSQQMVSSIEHMANAFDEFNADMDRYISTVEHAQAITSTYRNIIDLTGRTMSGFNSTMLKSINDAIAAQSIAKLEANKTKYDTVKVEYDEAKAAYEAAQASYAAGGIDAAALKAAKDTYQAAQDNMNEAQETFLSSWEEALQAAADAFQSNMEAAVRDIGDMMSGGLAGGLSELEDAFAKMNERDQNYVDDYEKIYQLTKMTRDLTDKIDSTSNVRAQKELLKYQKELNGLLESDQKMSAYDLDYLQKKLDLKLAEIALDEAQNAKSQVTMRRDSEGNYNYVYTADENAVEKAESDYADRLYEMQKANDEYITGLSENMANLSSQMLSEIAAIDTTIYDTEEKYQAEVQRITDHYTSQMEYYNSEMNKVLGNNKTLYEQDWTNFSKYTGYKLSAEENYVTKWSQTVLSQVTGFKTQEEFYENFNKAIFGGDPAHPSGESLIGRLVTAYKTMREQIAAANAAAGVETEDLATALLGNIEAATQEAEAAADGITEAATEIVQQITSIGDAVTNMVNNYSQAMATMEAETDAMLGVLLDFLTAYGAVGDLEIDEGVLAEINRRRQERQENPEGYDTGGYTGAWGSEGRLAYLHQKELVLNAEDTANMLASVGILRQIANVIDLNALASAGGFISLMSSGVAGNQGTLQQEVHIEASFPAVTDKNQIEEAFGDLVNLAAQYANRKL